MATEDFKVRCATLLRAMGKTLSQLSLYTLKHPTVQQSITDNHSALELLLREAERELTLSADKDALLVNGQLVASQTQAPAALLNFFKRFELHGVTFLPGVTAHELTVFYEALVMKPEALEGKTLQEYLDVREVSQIRPNADVYVKMEKNASAPETPVVVPGAPESKAAATAWEELEKLPLEDAVKTLVQKAVPNPEDRGRVLELLKERLKQDIESRIAEATRDLQMEKTKLVNERQRTDLVVNNMSEAVVVVDEQGNVLLMNQAAENLYGKKLSELAGKPLLASGKPGEQLVSMADEIGTPQDRPVSQKVVTWGEENVARSLKASSAVVRNEQGAVVGMVSGLADVAKFQELQRVQDEFVAQVTHELRSPLTSITAALSILSDQFAGKLNSDQDRILHLASRNADRLAALINDILDFSKLQEGQMTVHPVPIDPKKLLKEASDSLEPWARQKGLSFKLETADDLPQVFSDPKRFVQVVVNLLSNAIKFSPKSALIEIKGAKDPEDDAFLRFSVRDHGQGMTKDEMGRIFEKFVQLMAGEKQAAGTGLGLSIAKALVLLHKGRIWVESVPGAGTIFLFTIPVFRPEMIGEKPKTEAAPPPPPPRAWWQKVFGG